MMAFLVIVLLRYYKFSLDSDNKKTIENWLIFDEVKA